MEAQLLQLEIEKQQKNEKILIELELFMSKFNDHIDNFNDGMYILKQLMKLYKECTDDDIRSDILTFSSSVKNYLKEFEDLESYREEMDDLGSIEIEIEVLEQLQTEQQREEEQRVRPLIQDFFNDDIFSNPLEIREQEHEEPGYMGLPLGEPRSTRFPLGEPGYTRFAFEDHAFLLEQELQQRLQHAQIMETHEFQLQNRLQSELYPSEIPSRLKTYPPSFIEQIKNHEKGPSCDCSICLEVAETPVKLYCGHQFHSSCIIEWIKRDFSCPFCRQKFQLFSSTI